LRRIRVFIYFLDIDIVSNFNKREIYKENRKNKN